jgi:tetratricopeptide (TPR) repeat protein
MPSHQVPPEGAASQWAGAASARSQPDLDEVERALLAQLHFASGGWHDGLAACAGAASRGLKLLEARGHFGSGQRATALQAVEQLLTDRPDDALALYYKAQFLAQSARPQEAVQTLDRLIERLPDFPGALTTLASLVFPGPAYREVLARVHEALRPRSYLEIGVEHGTSLALAVHSHQVVGVDPVPRPPARALPAGARLFHMTSDTFFERYSCADVFGAASVDLAFIDGMHWFEYALRDFRNVERWCGAGSTIVLHDCLPPHPVAAARERRSNFWVGDTWKALECLLELRPDLKVTIVPCFPSGLVVMQNLDPGSTLLAEALESLTRRYLELGYPHAPGAFPSHYPILPNAEPQLGSWLGRLREALPARGV